MSGCYQFPYNLYSHLSLFYDDCERHEATLSLSLFALLEDCMRSFAHACSSLSRLAAVLVTDQDVAKHACVQQMKHSKDERLSEEEEEKKTEANLQWEEGRMMVHEHLHVHVLVDGG